MIVMNILLGERGRGQERAADLAAAVKLLAIGAVQQGLPEPQVSNRRRAGIDVLGMKRDPESRPVQHLAVAPLVAQLKRILDRESASERQLDASRKQVGDECVRVENETHLELVQLRPTANVVTVGFEDDRRARVELP